MTSIQLTKIVSEREQGLSPGYVATDEPGEPGEASEPVVITTPVSIFGEAVRCYYPRKDNKPGTRITFRDGGGFAVIEDYDTCRRLIG